MDTLQIKKSIVNRINEIEDPQILQSIDTILNTSDENLSKFLNFAIEKIRNEKLNETEYFTDYIKEWVKSM